jgi:hypothetical protein
VVLAVQQHSSGPRRDLGALATVPPYFLGRCRFLAFGFGNTGAHLPSSEGFFLDMAMWKIVVGFIVFAGIALFVLSKGGDIDMSGEKHGIETTPASGASAAK